MRDNGAGVPADVKQHLFEPFVTTKATGSGLGLALVAKIIGDHGGVIECESHPRKTVFRMLMPMYSRRGVARRGFERCHFNARGNILVADDDAAIRTVVNQALARAGYECAPPATPPRCGAGSQAGEGDLVITDVVMPDENAFELLPRIKKLRPELPIIVMSAQNTFMTAIKASERGAYEYLPKPFDLKELLAIVGRAMSEPKNQLPRRPKPRGHG